MMLHDFTVKSSFIHFTHQKVTEALCSLSAAVRAWQIVCADCSAHTLVRLSTKIRYYTNYGHCPATEHSVQPSRHAESGVLNSWSWRHEFDSYFLETCHVVGIYSGMLSFINSLWSWGGGGEREKGFIHASACLCVCTCFVCVCLLTFELNEKCSRNFVRTSDCRMLPVIKSF